MQSRVLLPALAAALLAASAAQAETTIYATASLATPATTSKTTTLGGLDWSCEAGACRGVSLGDGPSWSSMYACKKTAAAFGPLTAWRYLTVNMTTSDLTICNKAAGTTVAGAN